MREGRPCALLCFELVRPQDVSRTSSKANEFVTVCRSELPEVDFPAGALCLTECPGGTLPLLTLQPFQIYETLTGAIYVFFLMENGTTDWSHFLGRVYSVC